MISRVTIGHGYTRWKTATPIPPGEYYRLDRKPSELGKKRLGTMAAADPCGGWYGFICPCEEWVPWALQGQFVKETSTYGKEDGGWVWGMAGFDPHQAYAWQKRFVADAGSCLLRSFDYRRLAIVGFGGGKTLAGLLLLQLGEHSLVAAPRFVHQSWRDDAAFWGLPCPRLTTPESLGRVDTSDLDVLVLDEITRWKNPEAKRSRDAREASKRAKIVVGLTGAPIAGGGPLDWRSLDVIRPGCIPANEMAFRFNFADSELDPNGKKAEHVTRKKEVAAGRTAYVTPAQAWDTDKIARYVAPFVFRVNTDELLAHLPPVRHVKMTVPQPRDWDVVIKGAATERGPSKRVMQALTLSDGFLYDDAGEVIRLDTNKVDACVEWVEGLGEPVVLIAMWRETIALLAERLKDHRPAVISGGLDVACEQSRFTSGDTDVLILNAAMGAGINGLQRRCRIGAFLSMSRQPDDYRQTVSRLMRVGQSRGVQIVHFHAEGTLDARRLELIEAHGDLSASMLEKLLASELGD